MSYFYRVSSVINRDTKQFGKKHLIDGHVDTCWNSDQVHDLKFFTEEKRELKVTLIYNSNSNSIY